LFFFFDAQKFDAAGPRKPTAMLSITNHSDKQIKKKQGEKDHGAKFR